MGSIGDPAYTMTTIVLTLSDADAHRLNAIEDRWRMTADEAVRRLIRDQATYGAHSRLHGRVVTTEPCNGDRWLIASFEDGTRMLVKARETA